MRSRNLCLPLLAAIIALMCGLNSAQAADAEMPLELYQKIKIHFDRLYGPADSLVSAAPGQSKAEVEKELRSDAAANKEVLIRALKAAKPVQRELAAMALEYCGDKKSAVAALLPVVDGDTDLGVRRAAVAVLARLPDASAVEPLIKALSDDADSLRGIAATALGNIKDNRAVEPLLKVLKNDAKAMVRLQSAMALSKIKDASALDGLKSALDAEKDERVKMAIAGALRGLIGADTDKTSAVPSAGEAAGELTSLANEMKEIEAKLREDRHDQAVQAQGKGVEDKLTALIEKLDKG